jgi:hypothetical protein
MNTPVMNHRGIPKPCNINMQEEENMKKICATAVFLMLMTASVSMAGAWQTTLFVCGENNGGVYQQEMTLGVAEEAEVLPAPPVPPLYSVNASLFNADWAPLWKDIRPDGKTSYEWIIGVDPHGNTGTPASEGTCTLTWGTFQMGKGTYELRQGSDGKGEILIPDMKNVTSFKVSGKAKKQYFTIVYVPEVK